LPIKVVQVFYQIKNDSRSGHEVGSVGLQPRPRRILKSKCIDEGTINLLKKQRTKIK